ncbi:DUF2461 domain-containing protein [Sungkyunkwania multivorans]|uniref:DUF2461 domain-containing protein n=1 Tax=Sungkyunkwania multivorans TaxID=1173618 RepID=A0ABW3CVI3_9FLAO
MVSKEYIFRFLRDLRKNNSKDWMDEHRDRYETAKERWIEEVSNILERLSRHNAEFDRVDPKKTIERINNNLLYHPNKPTYKHHFGCEALGKKGNGTLYISIGPSRSFVGGGIHNPSKEDLDNLREAIDYNGEELRKIIDSKDIQDYFGGLTEDDQKLKTAPRGYDQDHEHIELLRRKDFTVMKQLTEEEVTGDHFIDIVEEAHLKMRPFNSYLQEALGK